MGKTPGKSKPLAPTEAQTSTPNFELVGPARSVSSELLDLIRFADIKPFGRNKWHVKAKLAEWIDFRVPGHIVWLDGGLHCTCRQGMASRICVHVIAVRQMGFVRPKPLPRGVEELQMRLLPDNGRLLVRIAPPKTKGGRRRG